MPERKRLCLSAALVLCLALLPGLVRGSARGQADAAGKIRVGVFDGHGGSQTCIRETLEALRIDPEIDAGTVTSAQIASGALDGLDVLVIPGGSGSRQYLNLGGQNHERIRRFVGAGGGAVGICAGAYFFSATPGYAGLAMNGNRAIDIEHDNRGHGVVRFTLTAEGKALFPELAARAVNYMAYYEGPVFVDAPDAQAYAVLAVMDSDVHEEGGAPAGMTNNKPFFVANGYGRGRVFSSIAHPEATPGMRWMVPRMARWAARKELKPYPDRFVRPALFEREILFSAAMLKQEAALFQTLLYGKPEEKTAALDWLESRLSWDAKRWVQGLLHDASPLVRARARRYVENSELTMYAADIEAQGESN